MNNKSMLVMLIAIVAFYSPSNLMAQDDDDGNIFTVSIYQWPFNNLDDIFEAMEEDKDLVMNNEFLISRKILVHQWAGAFSVMIVPVTVLFLSATTWIAMAPAI